MTKRELNKVHNQWAIREVWFDGDGNPTAHRAAPQPSAEPVAWVDQKHLDWLAESPDNLTGTGLSARQRSANMVPLYNAPQPAKPAEQEPVAWMHPDGRIWTFGRGFDKATFTVPLYTAPPTQEACKPAKQPLTDEEIAALWLDSISGPLTAVKFARAIERAHGITKNK